ncbi:MAG TPA: VOC family protein [Candidatus Kapabacteria bacterium]|nr:VOC family protein [Candidatus Kapabacteria bacterium]
MAFTSTQFLSAVLLVSKDAERLARFYRDVIGIPLEEEQHDDTAKHYGCELGDLHFAIHPMEDFASKVANPGVGSVKLAFEIFDMDGFIEHLQKHGIAPLYPPKPLGKSRITALRDPDGNEIEFTQLSGGWFEHLKKRRMDGHDILERWNEIQKTV